MYLTASTDQDTPSNPKAYDFRAGSVQVWQCFDQGFAHDATYCCESESEKSRCCSTSSALLHLASASVGAFTGSATPTFSLTSTTIQTGPPSTSSTRITDNGAPKDHKGAIAGGTIGGVIALASLICCAVLFWRRHHHNSQHNITLPQQSFSENKYYSTTAGSSIHELSEQGALQELHSNEGLAPQELPVEERRHELLP